VGLDSSLNVRAVLWNNHAMRGTHDLSPSYNLESLTWLDEHAVIRCRKLLNLMSLCIHCKEARFGISERYSLPLKILVNRWTQTRDQSYIHVPSTPKLIFVCVHRHVIAQPLEVIVLERNQFFYLSTFSHIWDLI